MRADQFLDQLRRLGAQLHEHDGVWWRRRAPFYWWPAIEFQEIEPGSAMPAAGRALAGYGHVVPDSAPANSARYYMVLEAPEAGTFGLETLSSKKRNQVRKGLRTCAVRRLSALEELIPDLQRINISTRRRTGSGLPEEYYVRRYGEWRRRMLAIFALPERDWWGAFVGERLVGYFHSYAIDNVLIIDAAKCETESLKHNPSDALLFTLLEDAFNVKGCRRVIYGGWVPTDEKLTAFKEKHGFRRTEFRAFRKLSPVAAALHWVLRQTRDR